MTVDYISSRRQNGGNDVVLNKIRLTSREDIVKEPSGLRSRKWLEVIKLNF